MKSTKTFPPYISVLSVGPLHIFGLAFYMNTRNALRWGYGLGDLFPMGILLLTIIVYIFGAAWAIAKGRSYNKWVGGLVWSSLLSLAAAFVWFRGSEYPLEACMRAVGWA